MSDVLFSMASKSEMAPKELTSQSHKLQKNMNQERTNYSIDEMSDRIEMYAPQFPETRMV